MEITYIGGSFPDNLYILRIKLCISFFDLGLCNPDIIRSKGKSVEFGGVFKKCFITVFPDILKNIIYSIFVFGILRRGSLKQ